MEHFAFSLCTRNDVMILVFELFKLFLAVEQQILGHGYFAQG